MAWRVITTTPTINAIKVASSAAGWSVIHTITGAETDRFGQPALAADKAGNIYLAYTVAHNFESATLYLVENWGPPQAIAGAALESNQGPVMVTDRAGNLTVGWIGPDYDLRLRKKMAATGQWAEVEILLPAYRHVEGFDLAVDSTDTLHWLADTPIFELGMVLNGETIAQIEGWEPTLAIGPGNTPVALWSGSLQMPQRAATKRYFAAGRQLALRVDGVLYYTLLDPTGASLTLTKENGDPAGYILYDAYGKVLANNITNPALQNTLTGQGATTDPATGLIHLGNGRYYAPLAGQAVAAQSGGRAAGCAAGVESLCGDIAGAAGGGGGGRNN